MYRFIHPTPISLQCEALMFLRFVSTSVVFPYFFFFFFAIQLWLDSLSEVVFFF